MSARRPVRWTRGAGSQVTVCHSPVREIARGQADPV
jgi:hypothetical protein